METKFKAYSLESVEILVKLGFRGIILYQGAFTEGDKSLKYFDSKTFYTVDVDYEDKLAHARVWSTDLDLMKTRAILAIQGAFNKLDEEGQERANKEIDRIKAL
jgi:hypothetical protein